MDHFWTVHCLSIQAICSQVQASHIKTNQQFAIHFSTIHFQFHIMSLSSHSTFCTRKLDVERLFAKEEILFLSLMLVLSLAVHHHFRTVIVCAIETWDSLPFGMLYVEKINIAMIHFWNRTHQAISYVHLISLVKYIRCLMFVRLFYRLPVRSFVRSFVWSSIRFSCAYRCGHY